MREKIDKVNALTRKERCDFDLVSMKPYLRTLNKYFMEKS